MAQLAKPEAERDLKAGVKVYYLNLKTKTWAVGEIVNLVGQDKVSVKDGAETVSVEKVKVHKYMEHGYDPENDDLFSMSDLHQSTLLYCIKDRFEKLGRCYTRMGEIILAVNPFQPMSYNSEESMKKYIEEGSNTVLPPHCWIVAHKSYDNIVVRDCGNQSILISGESGSGKTETTKMLMKYLGSLAGKGTNAIQREVCASVSKKLQDSNPILESFGNAKTVRNDNSSRFGKYIKLLLHGNTGVVIGAEMITYLLEKSRVCVQAKGERGYHVFYEFLKGASPEEKTKYGLREAKDYRCLNQGNVYGRQSIDGSKVQDDAEEFKKLVAAMEGLGIGSDKRNQIFSVLAAILHLQNVEFGTEDSTGKSVINNMPELEFAARLLGINAEEFSKTLLIKVVTNIATVRSSKSEAEDMRDAVSKALYVALFDWLVAAINQSIRAETPEGISSKYIGILDIFGFEHFPLNSFEQLCINYTNEALQNHYNKYTFVEDAEECKREGIPCPILQYTDNQLCVDLIDRPPSKVKDDSQGGIFSLLDAECAFKLGTDESFTQKVWEAWKDKNAFFILPKSTKPDSFGIHHYAGDVSYTTSHFLEKNADTLKDKVREIISQSTAGDLVKSLLPVSEGETKKTTVCGKFKNQLTQLLIELRSTESHFIRCIKPNPAMKPKIADPAYVLAQLNSAGVMQTIQMKREGFPVRLPVNVFWNRFRCIAPIPVRKLPEGNEGQKCGQLTEAWIPVFGYSKKDFAIGKTKVFMRPFVMDVLEVSRHRKLYYLHTRVITRGLKRYISFMRKKIAERKEQERLKAEAEAKRLAEEARIQAEEEARKKAEAEAAAAAAAAAGAAKPPAPSGGVASAAMPPTIASPVSAPQAPAGAVPPKPQPVTPPKPAAGVTVMDCNAALTPEQIKTFEELARQFPHFDPSVVMSVVRALRDKNRCTAKLLEMQQQMQGYKLPRSLGLILDLAGISKGSQDKLVSKGYQAADKVFEMTEAAMREAGLAAAEVQGLKRVLLSQQAEKIAAKRYNQLYPIAPLNRVQHAQPTSEHDITNYSRSDSMRKASFRHGASGAARSSGSSGGTFRPTIGGRPK